MKYRWDPNIELNGVTTYAFLSSVQHDEFASILEKHGLDEVDPEKWYPLEKVLNVLYEMSQQEGARANLISLGMAAADNIKLPPEIAKLPPQEILKLYEKMYPSRHRNGSPGSIKVDILDPKHVRITLDEDVPYPDDVMYGVFYGYMRRFSKEDPSFVVAYDEDKPRKDVGGTETVIHVTWEK